MNWKSFVNRAARIGVREGLRYLRQSQSKRRSGGRQPREQSRTAPQPGGPGTSYPGDYAGPVSVSYSPDLDGDADPGEIVWGGLPFEEDHTQGKDRHAVVVGRGGGGVLALLLTRKDH